MFEKRENLCKSVIDDFLPKDEWKDEVHLSDLCKERFLSHSQFPEFDEQDIFMAGLAQLEESYYVERQSVDVHTILFTVEGGGVLITKDWVKLIEPNTMVVLPAHTPFRFEINPQIKKWKMVWFLPRPTGKWDHLISLNKKIIPFHECEQIWSLTNLIHCEIHGRAAFRRLLLSELVRYLNAIEEKATTSSVRVQALFNEIESQLHLPWKVSEMAQSCFISEEQLSRIAKSLYGQSPRSRLITLRMEKACELLNHKDWSIAMIANRLGYRDPYNFTHRFKRYHGVSPSAYRKAIKLMDG